MKPRVELKYLVPIALLQEIRDQMLPYLTPDPMAGSKGWYQVFSTYFDSPHRDAFYNKLEGKDPRIKLRIRTYDQNMKSVFLESKLKNNLNIKKIRVAITPQDFPRVFEGRLPENPISWPKEDFQFLAYLVERVQFSPSIQVIYRRYPFRSDFHPSLRITLDTQNRYMAPPMTPSKLLTFSSSQKFFLPPDLAILEIKSNHGFPSWLLRIVEFYSLQIQAISKYCMAVSLYQRDYYQIGGY